MASRLELRVPPVALVITTAAMMWAVARAAPGFWLAVPYQKALESRFGREFVDYTRRARRWL